MNKRVNELYIAAESLKEWFVSNWPAIETAFDHPDIQKVAKAFGISITDPGTRIARLDRALIPFRGSAVEVVSQEKPKGKFSEVAEMSFLTGRAFMLMLNAMTEEVVPKETVEELRKLALRIDELGTKEAPWLFEGTGIDDGKRDTHDKE